MAVQAAEGRSGPLGSRFRAARTLYWAEIAFLTVAISLSAGAGIALVAALLSGWQAPPVLLRWVWMVAAAAPLAGVLAGLLLRPSPAESVRVLDLRLQLGQQLGTAQELISTGATGRLVPLQLARAEALAGEVEIGRAFHLLPARELLVAAILGAMAALVMVLAGLGITLPNPLLALQTSLAGASREAALQQSPYGGRQGETPRSRSAAMEPVRDMVNRLQSQAQRGSLSAAAAAASLAQANAELNRIAAQSRTQQEALDNLANELRGTAAGRQVAESLRQGDYEKAASQISDIGQESDQLSAAAKAELSQALGRAAARSQSSPDLSRSASKAAQALDKRDYQATTQAMDQLSQAVSQAANKMVPQSELADSWRQLEDINRQVGGQAPLPNDPSSALSPPMAQATQGTGDRQQAGSGQQPGSERPNGTAQGPMQEGNSPMAGAGDSQQGAGQGPAGNMRGGDVLGKENPSLGANGNAMDVPGKVGNNPSAGSDPSAEPPTVLREGRANSTGSANGGSINGPVSVPAESVYVPGDRRPVIRDYFSKGTGAQ